MARRRGGLLGLVCALALAGCGEGEGIVRGGTIIGETLTVYSVLPSPASGAARDVVDGQRLALAQAGGRAGAFKINFTSLDATDRASTPAEVPGQVASAIRTAIADAQVVAVIADREPATARISVPLLNSAGILHVSAGVPGAQFAAERYYPAGERTFFTPTRRTAGPPPADLRADFVRAFGREPTPAAYEGHAAMRAVLAAVARAGPRATNRQAVIEAFRAGT